ncbi:hypothetical protein PILCRDRAFT_820390 [Piloderma croceum F 1598]|uniref:Uncharacterized protein n=1 Tax=Piloderma croceum (strain F 1598) TaxID=765440 RepID=A0A0C3BYR8_PILCF|nr:hypothetical protein PILCRDRAFT_820390 [Piloderma croceum F 1598]
MTLSPGRPGLRYITQAFARLRRLLQPPGAVVSKVEIPHPPLFESEPPTGFRYAIPLAISLGTFIIGACDLAVTRWARLEEKPSSERPAESPSSNSPTNITSTGSPTEPEEPIWVLRPLWQRAALASTYMAVSLAFGVMFFGSRARYVRRLHIISAPSQGTGSAKGRSLFFQTCDNSGMYGRVVPLRRCKMKLVATDWTRVLLEVNHDGNPTLFRVGTAGAKINGKETLPSQVFAELVKCGVLGEVRDKGRR